VLCDLLYVFHQPLVNGDIRSLDSVSHLEMFRNSSEAYASIPKVKGRRYHFGICVRTQETVVSNEESSASLTLVSRYGSNLISSVASFDYSLGATEAASCRRNDLTVELD